MEDSLHSIDDALVSSDSNYTVNIIDLLLSKDFDENDKSEENVVTSQNHFQETEEDEVRDTKVEDNEEEKEEGFEEKHADVTEEVSTSSDSRQDNSNKNITDSTSTSSDDDDNDDNSNKEKEADNGHAKASFSKELEELWNEALQAQNRGDFKSAIEKFTAILEVG